MEEAREKPKGMILFQEEDNQGIKPVKPFLMYSGGHFSLPNERISGSLLDEQREEVAWNPAYFSGRKDCYSTKRSGGGASILVF